MIWQATWAGFDHFQREAGYTRTGSHHARVNGRETGQWHKADLAVAHWLQHTSRDGDMQLHVHSQIAHIARTETDGKWRAPNSLGYNECVGAVAAIVAQHLEEAQTRRFGLLWLARGGLAGGCWLGVARGLAALAARAEDPGASDNRITVTAGPGSACHRVISSRPEPRSRERAEVVISWSDGHAWLRSSRMTWDVARRYRPEPRFVPRIPQAEPIQRFG